MRCILGIDPGLVSGALAVYRPADNSIDCFDVPVIGEGAGRVVDVHAVKRWVAERAPDCGIIERVGAMKGQGVGSTFRFGDANGSLRTTVTLAGIPLVKAEPSVWKKRMGLNSEADRSRQMAIERFPAAAALFARKKDHNRAEAALLALYRTLI